MLSQLMSDVSSPKKHIITFLWYIGHENADYRDADRFGITISTLYNVIPN